MLEEGAAPSAAPAQAGSRLRVATPALLAAVVVAGAGLRFIRLGERSLWVDELTTAQAAALHSLGEVLAFTPVNRMPLDLVLAWSLGFLGDGDAAVRVPAAVYGSLLVAAVFLLTRRLFGLAAGFVAAVAVAVSPFAVWYSQDASPYTLLMLLVTLQAWAAHRAAEYARLRDWLLLALLTALALYTHYTDLLVSAALFAYIAFELVRLARDPKQRWVPVITRALGAITAAMLVLLALAPWAPAIRAFLSFQSGAQVVSSPAAADLWTRIYGLLDGLAIEPLTVLVLLGLPIAARRAPIVLFWLLLPLAGLLVILHGDLLAAPPRYLAITWPALAVLAGGGACAIASYAKERYQVATAQLAAVLAVAVVLLSLPGLLRWYAEPKDDWRGAAAVVQADRSAGIVLTMGAGSDWAATSIAHYLHQAGSRVPVFDAGGSGDNRATVDTAAAVIGSSYGNAWAVFVSSRGPADLRAEARSATGVFPEPATSPVGFREFDLVGVTLVRGPSVAAVLDYGAGFIPAVRATAALAERRAPGTTVLPPASEVGPFHVESNGPPADRTWVASAVPDTPMVASFQCSAGSGGDARVYVSAHDAHGTFIGLYPDNSGYRCGGGRGAFAFATPPGTTQVKLWLRVTGRGSGDFADVTLGKVAGR